MKIKLVLLVQDLDYSEKLMQRFLTDYVGKLEISSFRTVEAFERYLKDNQVHIILAEETMELDFDLIPKKAAFAYLTSMMGIQEIKGHQAICKFQKADVIYREILNIFSDSVPDFTLKAEAESAKLYLFSSPKGGCGTTTVAVAFAAELVKNGQKAVYLNLENFGFVGSYLKGEGNSDFGDIIFTIKSKKSNLSLKLQSTVKKDSQTGVDYFEVCKNAYDMLELTEEEKIQIITELASRNGYDAVIIDYDFFIREELFSMIERAAEWFLVCDGTELAIKKTERMMQAMKVIENRKDTGILEKAVLIYNRFDEKKDGKISLLEHKVAGIIPRLEGYDVKKHIQKIAEQGYLTKR